jgi:hypothetical protein
MIFEISIFSKFQYDTQNVTDMGLQVIRVMLVSIPSQLEVTVAACQWISPGPTTSNLKNAAAAKAHWQWLHKSDLNLKHWQFKFKFILP